MNNESKSYKPESLVMMLNEVERELRRFGRADAAHLVKLSASAVAVDVLKRRTGQRYLM